MVIELFNIVGIIAFAASGAITALDEDYDILGFYVLGFITSFGGGTIRNLLIGTPIQLIWSQNAHFIAAFITITLVFSSRNNGSIVGTVVLFSLMRLD